MFSTVASPWDPLGSFAYAGRVSIRELTTIPIRTLDGCYDSVYRNYRSCTQRRERAFVPGVSRARSGKGR